MRNSKKTGKVLFVSMLLLFSVTGCTSNRHGALPPGNSTGTGGGQTVAQSTPPHTNNAPRYIGVTKTDYDEAAKEARIEVQSVNESDLQNNNNEGILDTAIPEGIVNFATSQLPGKTVNRIRVKHTGSGAELFNLPVTDSSNSAQSGNRFQAQQFTGNTSTPLPPPGVEMDKNIQPLASLNASSEAKVAALRKIAESKLGMPYVWGHNEDRGEYGFDCSNYTSYVYHHALGYSFTTSSRNQYSSVGKPVPFSDMRPGDLLAFKEGAHVGIYMGDGQMIQMGGGTGKCSYLPVTPDSFWYGELSSVKRMF
ncbi:C40 family peptidase [Paenibacillus sp. NPDC056579]|uniref:C40 family peptidase n=1 Tax=Paenibacillus sp. NPDC056579 TaxID=3345871 RepID=UPI00369BAD81